VSKYLRPHLTRIVPYAPGKPTEELERELGITDAVKLASNENPLGPSPRAQAAMRDAVAGVHRYPDSNAHLLRHKLAGLHAVNAAELAFGHGSNELIDLCCRTFAGPGAHAVIGVPSFACYRLSLMAADVAFTEVPLDDGVYWNAERMLAAIVPSTRLLFLDNPNNPTSTHLGREGLTHLLTSLPEHVIAVVDEAYVQYADAPDYESALVQRGGLPNLIVLRTFSKAYGLAAARIGYAIAPTALIEDLERGRVAFNTTGIAQAGALAALDDVEHVKKSVELNRRERAATTRALRELGLAVAPSQANFLWVEFATHAAPIYEALLKRGVITRAFAGMPQHLRISIGLPEENARMLDALRERLA
jgi:histidinol-phosphate aminotransferase